MNAKNMNFRHWLKSMTQNTQANRLGAFAICPVDQKVDCKVGIFTTCLLLNLHIYNPVPIYLPIYRQEL